jgi:hypothetical protein
MSDREKRAAEAAAAADRRRQKVRRVSSVHVTALLIAICAGQARWKTGQAKGVLNVEKLPQGMVNRLVSKLASCF